MSIAAADLIAYACIRQSEIQTVTIGGGPTGGTFTLTLSGQTTGTIAYNAAASVVQTALEALSTIGTGNVAVAGSAGGPYTCTFQGTLANQDVAAMTANAAGLTPSGTVTIVTTQAGNSGRPENDTEGAGGLIDTKTRVVFTQLAANDTLRCYSSAAGDTTQTVSLTGLKADGTSATVTAVLNGTTPVNFSPTTTFERVLKCSMNATAVGTVTIERVTGSVLVQTIPIGELGFTSLFINSQSESSTAVRFEKFHYKNTHGSLTGTSATVKLTADPAAKIRMGVHTAKNDSVTISNRKTSPGGITFVDDNVAQDVPGTTLEAGSSIGVWMEQTLGANDAVVRSTFDVQLQLTTT